MNLRTSSAAKRGTGRHVASPSYSSPRAPTPSKLDERGVSLVEMMIGMLMLTTALFTLAGAAGLALRTTIRGREDLEVWAAVQRKGDSLVARGAGNITTGSDVVDGRAISWTVSGANPVRVDLVVDRKRMVDLTIAKDTLVLYMRD